MTYNEFLEDELLFSDDVAEKCPAATLAAEIIMLIKSIDDEIEFKNYSLVYEGGKTVWKEVIKYIDCWMPGDCNNCPHNCTDGYNGDYCGLPEVESNGCAADDGPGVFDDYGEKCPYHYWATNVEMREEVPVKTPIKIVRETPFHAQMLYQNYFNIRVDSRNNGDDVEIKIRTMGGMLLLHYMADTEDSDDDEIIECQHDWFIDAIIDKVSHRWDD